MNLNGDHVVHELRCQNPTCRCKLGEATEPYTRVAIVCKKTKCKRLNVFFGSLWRHAETHTPTTIVVR